MTPRQLTVGVLGHVDHGKTSLVKAMTGTDTDRLEEEKRRGLSIVLGFAYLQTDSGIIDFIDAPGHEHFIRTMISGATGIDAVILVVAADEGIKPQTREHFEIARLLGIEQGLVVINKSDLADTDLLDAARDEINEYVKGSFLENPAIYYVSSKEQTGLSELKDGLFNLLTRKKAHAQADNFYLPLDRVFTLDGFGTIGTGTLRNGRVSIDDEVEIMPSRQKASIRELQVHGKKVQQATTGQRLAVNLRGIKREQLTRGQVLIKPGSIHQTTSIHAKIRVLEGVTRLPKRNETVRFLFGTEEVTGKLRVLNDQLIQPGGDYMVQFRSRTPLIANTGEHFILRTCSPIMTFGGGEILDTSEALVNMRHDELVAHLERLVAADTAGRIQAHIEVCGSLGIHMTALAERALAGTGEIKKVIKAMNARVIENSIVIDQKYYENLSHSALESLKHYHAEHPSEAGKEIEQFRGELQKIASKEVVEFLIHHLSDRKEIKLDKRLVSLMGFSQEEGMSESDRELLVDLEKSVKDKGITTLALDELTGRDPARMKAYQYLKESGKLIPLREHNGKRMLVYHTDTLDGLREQLGNNYPPPGKFTVADFRSMTDSTRKYVIPILEYFDQCRITIRQGDYRVLAGE